MNKTILFQTDFKIESLNVLQSVLQNSKKEERFDILLVHGYYLSDSISDLLFFSKNRVLSNLVNQDFKDACIIIRNKYSSQVNSMNAELFTGNSRNSIKRFIKSNNVDEVYLPDSYVFRFENKRSFDIIPYLKKSGSPIRLVEWKTTSERPEKGIVAEVFFNEMLVS